MKKSAKNKILPLILCFFLGFTVAACASQPQQVPEESSVSEALPSAGAKTFINTLELPAGPYAKFDLPKFTQTIHEKYLINSDTVGWLQVPNTTINDVVVWFPGDKNDFYYRRNFDKKYDFNGIYYADYRCSFEGGASELSPNTVIYGHSMSDDPLHSSKLFSPLKLYLDPQFAKENPYIYFSVAEEDLIWEVFAVFYATVNLPYNIPSPPDFAGIVKECTDRSIYNYNTKVTAADKILTLSTCTYSLPGGQSLVYPNDYRYVVMAKLVTDRSALKNEADFVVNPAPKAP